MKKSISRVDSVDTENGLRLTLFSSLELKGILLLAELVVPVSLFGSCHLVLFISWPPLNKGIVNPADDCPMWKGDIDDRRSLSWNVSEIETGTGL